MPGTHKRTTTQRGLGHRHKQQVARLKTAEGGFTPGMPCWWCGEPMYLEQGLSGDHSTPRCVAGPHHLADRLLHAPCNTQRGDGSRDAERPALTGHTTQTPGTDLGTRTLKWPW